MTPYKQTIPHKPDEGLYGDCWRTAIACLLDQDPLTVPHFCNGADKPGDLTWRQDTIDWLRYNYGVTLFTIPITDDGNLAGVLEGCSVNNPEAYYLVEGESIAGGHVVIAQGGKIVHDPAGRTHDQSLVSGEDGVYFITTLVPVWMQG